MIGMTLALLAVFSKEPILVDSANCDSVQCYVIGEETFRDASVMVGKYGTLKSQNDTAIKLVAQYENTVRLMSNRIQLSDKKSATQDTLIEAYKKQVTSSKWFFGGIGAAIGVVIGLVIAVAAG